MPKLERFPAAVRATAPVNKIARQVVKQRVQAAAWYWKRVAQRHAPRVEDIHQLRVWSRRAIAAIELFGSQLPEVPARDLIRVLNKARKRAGHVRDSDILDATFDKQGRKALRETLAKLKDQREQAAGKLRRSYAKKVKSGRLRDLTKGALKTAHEAQEVLFGDWFRQEFATASAPFRKQLRTANWNPRQVHSLRIAGKRVRYALEIGLPSLPTRKGQQLYAALEAFQRQLGAICDDLSLSEQLRELASGTSEPARRSLLEAAAKRHQTQAKAGLTTFGRWWKSAAGRNKLVQLLGLNETRSAGKTQKSVAKRAVAKSAAAKKGSAQPEKSQ